MDVINKKLSGGRWSLFIGLAILFIFGVALVVYNSGANQQTNAYFAVALVFVFLLGMGFCINALVIIFRANKEQSSLDKAKQLLFTWAPFDFSDDEARVKFSRSFFETLRKPSDDKNIYIRWIGESCSREHLENLIEWCDSNSYLVSKDETDILRDCLRRRFSRTALDLFNEIEEFAPKQVTTLSDVLRKIFYYLRLMGHDTNVEPLAKDLISYLRQHGLDRNAATLFITDLDMHPNSLAVRQVDTPIWHKILSQLHFINTTT